MKKFASLLLCLTMLLAMSIPTFAAEPESANIIACQEITFEEAVMQKMVYDNISYEMAKEQLLSEEARILAQLPAPANTQLGSSSEIIKYHNYEETFTYPSNSKFKCAINATIVTFLDDGRTRLIDRVDMLSTRAVAGEHNYEWIQTGTSSNISYDHTSVRLSASGYFSTSYTVSGGASTGVPGFSFSSSVGNTYTYLSNTMYPTTTFYAH